jgi:multidrug efflux system membrane fusion protein
MIMAKEQTRVSRHWDRHWRWLIGVAVLAAAAVAGLWHRQPSDAGASNAAARPIPVTIADTQTQDVPIFVSAPGTVQAWNSVAVRSQIDGKLTTVNFEEGQDVRQGDVLAEIDPRALKATLDQAIAKKSQDEAQLTSARRDLARSQALLPRQAVPQQTVDQQQATVDQLKAAISADEAAIEAAQVQLSYASIMAPMDGRVGLRQLDPGNIIHASDPTPLTVLTLIRPAAVTFNIPQSSLFEVREALLHGPVATTVLDQDDRQQLAQGELRSLDNQVDQSTSTVRLKARFANDDERLWPGEFVRIRALVETRRGAVTIPSPALQRGPQGFFVWVVKPDDTAEARNIDAMPVDDAVTIVTAGLSPGERVVVDGQSRLEAGAHVEPQSQQAEPTPG